MEQKKKKKEEPVRRKGIYFLMKNINLLGTKMFSAPALCICTKSKNNVLINTAFCCFFKYSYDETNKI